ncbi:PREDICTED: probable E3 ubiquitin-protein ligase LUL4 [Erythranthe guttata]|uniref:probable E3 ubiquitin-protein ligase LUL4 n=1 Tax=Erythranthe guttata TaxID=4155 RepID=UPI00064DBC42|nr:PREDICTED: probable E3 ubiquitin-protein ligase LUL4 [Erythranthe guttata]|eukprot:XP_012837896.1 PREDICTED: probable E3 ubiquitin-protein ligase LUL4 [Erythranthe guttata]
MSQTSGQGPPSAPPLQLPPPPLQRAKLITNDVNVHKDTIRLQLDEFYPDCHLVSFTFDASVNGRYFICFHFFFSPYLFESNRANYCSYLWLRVNKLMHVTMVINCSITIFYFAEEGDECKFTPIHPEINPVKIQFRKGPGLKFCQPSGTGIDLGFFDIDELSKASLGGFVYPLVILAQSSTNNNAQITQAVLEKKNGKIFHVKVIKQILWAGGVCYELHDIYGGSGTNRASVSDAESENECIICFAEDKNTVVLPCRHMCMCGECAKDLRLKSNKCPICRQPIQELMEINFTKVINNRRQLKGL